jgi:protein-L-isoaspartate(D-aspartate) O-methyltransferase
MALVKTDAGARLRQHIATAHPQLDPRILNAFEDVPRHVFLPTELAARAYEDAPLPIGLGQTISQPSMIALMLAELECAAHHRVLEVGSGSGYVLALLSKLGCEIFGIERHTALAERARETLREIGLTDAVIHNGDGSLGWPEHAPYDRILISAAAPAIPEALLAELAEGGRLAMPVGGGDSQILVTCERDDKGTLHYRAGSRCVFVPLVSGVEA